MKPQLRPVLAPELASQKTFSDPVDVLARTLWGEARGEPVRGIEAVACVVLNRVEKARRQGVTWWGRDVVSVCRKPFQFSCWNADDPSSLKLKAVTEDNPGFAICLRIARRALAGVLVDPAMGATHYHARHVQPAWAAGKTPCVTIGGHLFYNDVE